MRIAVAVRIDNCVLVCVQSNFLQQVLQDSRHLASGYWLSPHLSQAAELACESALCMPFCRSTS